jgi:uncharacterized coiled-coil protein SlyX
MSLLTDILDRLSGVAALKEKIAQQDKVLENMQRIMLEQQREIAEVRGTLKALVAIQGGPTKGRLRG